ncbi:LCP family protein [Enemella sp. A6]|uniref:LCP family protein n=1 Tax=Enemella sp. A6 TaxID=3440152 RepID=UPI003EBDF2A0
MSRTGNTPDAAPADQAPVKRSAGSLTGWTVLSAIIPGVGLVRAGRRKAGWIILAAFTIPVLVVLILGLANRRALIAAAVDPETLRVATALIAVVAVLWAAMIVLSHLLLRGQHPSHRRRLGGALLVGVLVFAISAPMAVAARYSYDQAALVEKVFGRSDRTKSATRPDQAPDSWADKPRLNVLLLGGDGGKGREGVRTDTVIVASIDTATGATTLFSLPRNTARMPFPEGPLREAYPNGFTDGDGANAEYFLNAMYMNVPGQHPEILGETDNLGADVMKLSVGEALGLKIDYYALVNLEGFTELINAFGGVTLNINEYIAMGGNTDKGIPPKRWLSPGENQHLSGAEALWYARGRYGSDDFARMDRQRCVINAVIRQVNPQTVLTRYEAIARASSEIVFTDIPQELLAPLVELATRVQGGNVRSIVFKNGVDGFVSANPDFELMRERVQQALGESKKPPASPEPSQDPSSEPSAGEPAEPSNGPGEQPSEPQQPGGDPTEQPSQGQSEAPTSENVDDVCAYDPERAQHARENPPPWVN